MKGGCSMECCCYLRDVQDLLADGKTPYERRFGEPFKGPIIPFWSTGWISSDFTERSSKNSSIWQESITRNLSWFWVSRGWDLERRYSDSRSGFGKVGGIRYLSSKNQRERSVDQTKRWWIHIPTCRWYSKIVRKRLRIPRTHSEAGTNRKQRRFKQRTSRWTGSVSTDRIHRWRWSPCRLLVDTTIRWKKLHGSGARMARTNCGSHLKDSHGPEHKDDKHNSRIFIGTIQRRIACTGARMMRELRNVVKFFFFKVEPVVTTGAIVPSGPSAFCEAPAGLSLSSQRVRLKLSTSTQGSMLQVIGSLLLCFSAEPVSSWLETSVRFHFHDARVQLYVPKEETFPISLNYIDVTWFYSYSSGRVARKKYWRLLECRFEQTFVRFVERVHENYSVEEEAS